MEQLHNGFTLELCRGAFPLSTDSVALADFVKLSKNAAVLDLCSGCGTLGLMLCAKQADCAVTGVELQESDHLCALKNARRNGIGSRLNSICADVDTIPSFLEPGKRDVCVSNPPYFSGGPESKSVPLARREDTCSPDSLFRAAAWALRYGGDFYLVHRPERLADLCACAGSHGLEAKRLRLLRHRTGGPVSLILLQFRKGGKPGLIWEEESLYDENDQPTGYYRRLYHLD